MKSAQMRLSPSILFAFALMAYVLSPQVTRAQNLLPEGFHDGVQDGQHNFNCTAEGWAADPDNRDIDLSVRVLADNLVVAHAVASNYRPDLEEAGVCPGGTCAFSILLWGRIKKGVAHSITIQAKDAQTGQWTTLSESPKMLRCFAFSLTTFNPEEGVHRIAIDLPNVGQFVPRWSPDGRKIAHVVVGWKTYPTDFICNTYVADVKTGAMAPLPGADGSTHAVYSPDGRKIAYDRGCAGDFSIYVAPAKGGSRRLVRADALQPDWSPDSRRLVFYQPSDGSLRTVDVNGSAEAFVAFGTNPAWSPDGHWIAFNTPDLGDIWKIQVDELGNPLGTPIQLTADPLFEKAPSWSGDSHTIFFQSELADNFDPLDEEFRVWAISDSGGNRRELTKRTGMGVDISAWQNGNKLAYGGYETARHDPGSDGR